jgi:Chaperone of endosialidase/TGF-beta propeptide
MRHSKIRIFVMRILLAVIATLAATTEASAQMSPSADSYINTADATTNYGSSTLLDVDRTLRSTYIQFDLTSIPSGSTVARATLTLYVNSVATAGSFNVDYANGTWSEGSLDASNAPGAGAVIASEVAVSATSKNQYLLIDVTPAVQAWLNGSEVNNGVVLVANGTFNATFDSKENTGTSHPAELDIVFSSNNAGTLTGITTASSSGLTGGGTSGSLNLSLTTSCGNDQTLQWTGSAWACSSVGTGTITGITVSAGLSGGGTSGNLPLDVDSSQVPLLGSTNTFLATQQFNGPVNLPATIGPNTGVIYIGSTPMLHNYFGSSTSNPNNTFVGGAGNFSLTTANALVGVGFTALPNVTTSSGSVAVGTDALPQLTSGDYNTAVGAFAGQTLDSTPMTGSYNTFLGAGAAATTGNLTNAAAIGSNAVVGQSNSVVLGCVLGMNSCAGSVNVGIGTTSPQQTLDVSGGNAIIRGPQNFGVAGQKAYLYLGDTNHFIEAQNNLGLIIQTNDDPNPLTIYDGSNGIPGGLVTIGQIPLNNLLELPFQIAPGLGHALSDYWYTYSSRRWKSNVRRLHGALDKVERLRGVSYDLKKNGKHEIGVIAEEVGAVVPEVVTWDKNGKDATSVDYERLTALLIEATKEQQKLIRSQERQIKADQSELTGEQVAGSIRQSQINQLASQVKTVQAVLRDTARPANAKLAMSSPDHGANR